MQQTTETIKLTNNGTGPAMLRWMTDNLKYFAIESKSVVPPMSSIDVTFTYRPSNIIKDPSDAAGDTIFNNPKVRDALNRVDDEKVVLKVEDGME